MERQKILQVIEKEKQKAHKAGFMKGLVVGFFIPVLLFSVLVISVLFARKELQQQVGEYVVSHYMEQIFSTFPDAYFTKNRERVIKILDDFTNAASVHRVSREEFARIGRKFFKSLQDRQLTWKEMDEILELMQKAAEN
jgi:hypothetical protein